MASKKLTIGFDTSNYTTSAAVFDIESGEMLANLKMPLPVAKGERGLRQSEALFAHVKNLPEICERLRGSFKYEQICAIGYSAYPRDEAGSYMPCFLAGKSAAYSLASAGAPIYAFSHQAGHVMAALWHSGRRELLDSPFLAFHVSGGTTELLYVKPEDSGFDIELIGATADINAGQLVDRVGVMLGLSFPCGPALEELSKGFDHTKRKCTLTQKTVVKGITCNLSGAENKASKALADGVDKSEIAFFVLDFIARNLDAMTLAAKEKYGEMPVLYAGGVMSNGYIKSYLASRHDAAFAPPVYSADNACGTAILAAQKYTKDKNICI
ncbi:MAG: peptidase M22 [Clostridia bacterium]|nr:peptidase M22 [Clostridia bacterium]